MFSLNFKAVTSALAALAVTMLVSWAFVHDTGVVWAKRAEGASAMSLVSVLVR